MSQKKNTILIVDDEPQIRKLLSITIDAHQMKSEEAANGGEAIRLTASLKPDLIILDLGLPDMDGKEVIGKIREWTNTPIIVCSVRNEDQEMLDAFDLGADDYVTKPFNADVLMARVTVNLKKMATQEAGDSTLENGALKMDLVKHEVLNKQDKVDLTPKEYDLLRYFMVNKGRILTHRQILKEVWGEAHGSDTQYLRVYLSQVREKIEPDPTNPTYLVTETGIGYRMEVIDNA